MSASFQTGVAIFGGGVAGLWTLCKLRRAGIPAALFEAQALGGTQTISSQGILHSGMKYTLGGAASGQTPALAEMLPIWADCLEGRGELDLRASELRSPCTWFWSSGFSFGGLAAPMMLKSKVVPLKDPAEYPEALRHPRFSGRVSRIEERVISVKSLIGAFQALAPQSIFRGRFAGPAKQDSSGNLESARIALPHEEIELRAGAFIFCGGEGNALAAKSLGFGGEIAQVRPLGMIIVDPAPADLFGHCIITSKRPRATITTHRAGSRKIWYAGGAIAEEAARLDDAEAISWARRELAEIFPWFDFSHRAFRLHRVNRAEPRQTALVLPEGPRLRTQGNIALAWPTKLVLAPALAAEIQKWLEAFPLPAETAPLPFAAPPLAPYPWDQP